MLSQIQVFSGSPPNNLTEGTSLKEKKKSHSSSSPAPLLFPHCCDAANGGRGERSVARGYITRTCPLGVKQSSEHMYCICSTQVPVRTEHALLQTDKHPQPRSESREDEVLTVTWVDGWEKSSSWGGEGGGGGGGVRRAGLEEKTGGGFAAAPASFCV